MDVIKTKLLTWNTAISGLFAILLMMQEVEGNAHQSAFTKILIFLWNNSGWKILGTGRVLLLYMVRSCKWSHSSPSFPLTSVGLSSYDVPFIQMWRYLQLISAYFWYFYLEQHWKTVDRLYATVASISIGKKHDRLLNQFTVHLAV